MRAAASSQSSQFPSASLQGCQMRCSTTLSLILAIALASTASVASRFGISSPNRLRDIRKYFPTAISLNLRLFVLQIVCGSTSSRHTR